MTKQLKLISNKDPMPIPEPGPTPVPSVAVAAAVKQAPSGSGVKDASPHFRRLQYGLAALLAGIYVASIAFMYREAADAEPQHWERLLHLFKGLETIGFAAIGFILGTEIQRRGTVAEVSAAKTRAAEVEAEKKTLETRLDQLTRQR